LLRGLIEKDSNGSRRVESKKIKRLDIGLYRRVHD